METRANYVLIGAVTLLGIAAAFGFFLWYARIAIDRSFDYYDIMFDQVSGLSRAGDVRFNGILVGQVLGIDLARSGGTNVRVSIEVQDGTPINSGTVATLRSQGVTGVSFVSLASGPADAPPLEINPATGRRVIPSEPSVIDSLIEGAPELLREATELLRELSAIVGDDNQARVAQILSNVEAASGGLETALTDFSAISRTVREGVDQISAFTGRLDAIATQAETTLRTADTTLASATGAFDGATATLQSATGALDAARTTFQSADALIVERAPALVD
nr:MCE family protein [Paracoccaceae bacterium]